MRSEMIRRIESEEGIAGRRDAITFVSIILMLLGAIVLGHNTIYGTDPALVGTVAETPALVIPISNLLIGLVLIIAGGFIFRRLGR